MEEEEAMVKATTMSRARRDFISTTLSCMIEVSVAAVVLLCVFIQSVSGVTCPMQQLVCVCVCANGSGVTCPSWYFHICYKGRVPADTCSVR